MKHVINLFVLLASTVSMVQAHSQSLPQHGDGWPDWAYGQLAPISENDRVAPPCPDTTTRPIDCAYSGDPGPVDNTLYGLPGTTATYTRYEIDADYGPVDWYPDETPPAPPIVANGREEAGLRSCAMCHYYNGQGKTENGHISGLPRDYFLQQLELFASGGRRSADIRKANTNEMAMIAAAMTEEEKIQAADYYSAINFRKMVRVVESDEAPQVSSGMNGMLTPLDDEPWMPLGMRIIEVPENPGRTSIQRDPHGFFISYVPVGSLAKGEALVKTGGGKTIQCGLCHGEGQTGLGPIPGIAGRTASYTMRQLWDKKQGTRQSPAMVAVLANLDAEDLLYISAYLASLPPSLPDGPPVN